MYNLGDKVWYATCKSVDKRQFCPDCCGKKFLTVIMGDNSQVTIDCANCATGFEPSTGFVSFSAYEAQAEQARIIGVASTIDAMTEYTVSASNGSNYYVNEGRLSADEDRANAIAGELAKDLDKDEQARLKAKEKPTKSWAWHVSYHKRNIKSSEKQLAFHRAKLNVAQAHWTKQQAGVKDDTIDGEVLTLLTQEAQFKRES